MNHTKIGHKFKIINGWAKIYGDIVSPISYDDRRVCVLVYDIKENLKFDFHLSLPIVEFNDCTRAFLKDCPDYLKQS